MNLANVHFVDLPSGRYTIVTMSGRPDGFKGAYWQLYCPKGKICGMGESKGWDGEGAGSFPAAYRLGRAAARRRDRVAMKKAASNGGE